MNTHPMKLVTVICESLASDHVKKLLHEVGAHGWTLFDVEGAGAQGERPGDIKEFGNIQIEIIVPPKTADQLLERLHKDFFERFAMVAYVADIQVLRREKF